MVEPPFGIEVSHSCRCIARASFEEIRSAQPRQAPIPRYGRIRWESVSSLITGSLDWTEPGEALNAPTALFSGPCEPKVQSQTSRGRTTEARGPFKPRSSKCGPAPIGWSRIPSCMPLVIATAITKMVIPTRTLPTRGRSDDQEELLPTLGSQAPEGDVDLKLHADSVRRSMVDECPILGTCRFCLPRC